MNRTLRYILADDGKTPLECPDLLTWGHWFENGDRRRVAFDKVGDVGVSTVFLGLDHRWNRDGDPILWETMVFGGEHDGEQWRYSSYANAVAGHAAAIALVTGVVRS
jgi:hypothetical protein